MKYVIIGLGTCGALWYEAIRVVGDEICAICDPNVSQEDRNIPYFVEMDDFISAKIPCDFVVVSVPVQMHLEICSKLLNNGYNVVVEKPISYKQEHIKTLYSIARKKKKKILCAYHAAFGVDVEYFLRERECIESGLGVLNAFTCEFYDPYLIKDKLLPKALSLHGSYLDSSVNALSVLSRVFDLRTLHNLNYDEQLLSPSTLYSKTNYKSANIQGCIYIEVP